MGNVRIQWIKAHSNIHGNEMVDRAAKLGHKNDRVEPVPLSYKEMISCLQRDFKEKWQNQWKTNVEITNKRKHAIVPLKKS